MLWMTIALVAALLAPVHAGAETVDQFEQLTEWTASSSPGADVEIAQDTGREGMGMAMRIDFDFHGKPGYVLVHKDFALDLPPNYAFSFDLRGEAPQNNLEFKVIDQTGKNVWWYDQRDYDFPLDWQHVIIRRPRLQFAWGPAGGGYPEHVGGIEFAISTGSGGAGSVWIDDLRLEEREPASRFDLTATVRASTSVPGHEPQMIFDHDPATSWRSGSVAGNQWLLIDFLKPREYGGLVIDWDPEDYATSYKVEVSDDEENWSTAYVSTLGNGGRDYVYMPDAESRYIRLQLEQSSRGQGYGIIAVAVKPFEFSASPNQFFQAMAKDEPPGTYPKYLYGKQTYWTVVGVNGDSEKALLNEEGMLEVGRGAFSLEPFLYLNGKLIRWNSVHTTQSLEDGYLPIPSVRWDYDGLAFTVTAFAAGTPGSSTLYAVYRVENGAEEPRHGSLFLAIRPFQVNPPWQSLNMVGGAALIRDIALRDRAVRVNGERTVVSLPAPDHFGATTFEQGPVTDFLAKGEVPPRAEVSDPLGFAGGALQYSIDLQPGEAKEVHVAVPFHDSAAMDEAARVDLVAKLDDRRRETKAYWQSALGRVDFEVPPAGEKLVQTLRTNLAYVLINRSGAALQPGPRNYARSWIRDGALTSVALLETGFTEEVRDFLRWYATYQFPDGKVPCCIDRRGADPVAENDSNGEFVFAVADYYRYTHDVGFLSEMWPSVVRAVQYIATLRQERLTEAYRTPEMQAFYGLLPESISHEGYASRPVHSYWDDFFALRGLKDAAGLAVVIGDDEHAAAFAALRDSFRTDLYASIEHTMANHGIDYIPASVELGDFDPSSTSIALAPGGELANLPQPALTHTYDLYYQQFEQRRESKGDWQAYTPYEVRNVNAFIRLGQRERAHELLDFLLAGQRPAGWNEWAEVVWRHPAAPRFIGDMPHTWVGSSFIRAARAMFAYERESDRALVLAGGLPLEWVQDGPGIRVKRLPTHYGVLNYTLRRESEDSLVVRLSGDLAVPPGGIVLRPPLPRPLREVLVDGQPIQSFLANEAIVSTFPAEVVLNTEPVAEANPAE